jgi:protein-S-isoprenylcysteine O-methyltransferase Ste14
MLFEALGSFFFVFLLLVRLDQAWHGSAIAWLLSAQAAFTAFRIVFRKSTVRMAPWQIQSIAWLSAIAPLGAIASSDTGSLLAMPGLVLSIWSLDSLGSSFSISPSDRGLVQSGPYRILRHPMYAGELLSLAGVCVSQFLLWNWMVFAVFGVSIYMRIIEEESILTSYRPYTRAVPWRLIPFIW